MRREEFQKALSAAGGGGMSSGYDDCAEWGDTSSRFNTDSGDGCIHAYSNHYEIYGGDPEGFDERFPFGDYRPIYEKIMREQAGRYAAADKRSRRAKFEAAFALMEGT